MRYGFQIFSILHIFVALRTTVRDGSLNAQPEKNYKALQGAQRQNALKRQSAESFEIV